MLVITHLFVHSRQKGNRSGKGNFSSLNKGKQDGCLVDEESFVGEDDSGMQCTCNMSFVRLMYPSLHPAIMLICVYLTIIYRVSVCLFVCLFVRELLLQFACNRRQTPQSFSAARVKYTKGVGVSI